MAASLRSPPPFPAAFRRSRAVVRASSSSSSVVSSAPKARFVARRSESTSVQQLARPLAEYMSLPASQYSVLDAERIERVDESTFRCYVYRFRFFTLEVCPVLLVRVDEEPDGCCIRLLSCKLEGSPLVEAQNDKFSASMVNRVFCNNSLHDSTFQQLTSDTTIEVTIDIPFPFQAIPVEGIESSGRQVLEQLLRVMLPRFLKQLVKDYQAWASGDSSRKPLGTGPRLRSSTHHATQARSVDRLSIGCLGADPFRTSPGNFRSPIYQRQAFSRATARIRSAVRQARHKDASAARRTTRITERCLPPPPAGPSAAAHDGASILPLPQSTKDAALAPVEGLFGTQEFHRNFAGILQEQFNSRRNQKKILHSKQGLSLGSCRPMAMTSPGLRAVLTDASFQAMRMKTIMFSICVKM